MIVFELDGNNLDINKLSQEQLLSEKKITDEFVERYIPLVKSIALKILHSKKAPPNVDLGDLVSWGIEGLIKSKKGYDVNLKTKFETYAYYRIKGEILDSVRREWKHQNPDEYQQDKLKQREQIADFIEGSIEDGKASLQSSINASVEEAVFIRYIAKDIKDVASEQRGMKDPEVEMVDETYDELWKEIKLFSDQEKSILELFYVNGLKQKDVAKHLKMSNSRVSRMHSCIIKKLKQRLDNRIQHV